MSFVRTQLRTAAIFRGALSYFAHNISAAAEPAESVEFFEKRIRPVLSEQCYKCHSSTSEKLKGGLMLDSREALLKGGDTGPTITPGDPEKSLLIEAVRWNNTDMQMPPKKSLAPAQIADLGAWVKAGAPWPQEAGAKVAKKAVFDLEKRKQEHWCWQPLLNAPPPAVKDAAWPRTDADRFIIAKLEEKNLKPAPAADRRTLIRRASFDITGLPPTPEQVEAFMSDTSPDAFAKIVDALLASPHFGERWARHWLDLVRYAETRGHEFEPEIPNAWQYRDYVIRALNSDVPYDRFAAEHIAGDLLPPRIHPQTGANEAIIGTGFWFLGEEVHSPVDIRQDETDRMDNRLDVMGKTFLGVTIGCARCHDHKFDAISQRDYYAMQGYLISSGYRQARFETIEPHRQIAQQLDRVRTSTRAALLKNVADAIEPRVARLADALMAARTVLRIPNGTPPPDEGANDSAFVERIAAELKLAKTDPQNPLHAFAKIATTENTDEAKVFAKAFAPVLAALSGVALQSCAPSDVEMRGMAGVLKLSPTQIIADYTRAGSAARRSAATRSADDSSADSLADKSKRTGASRDVPAAPMTPWIQDGFSFGPRPLRAGDPLFGASADQPLLGINVRTAAVRDAAWKSLATKGVQRDVGKLGEWERSEQTLRTPDVALAGERLWYLVKGAGRAYAAVDSHLIIRGPLHGALLREWKADGNRWQWVEHSLKSYAGHRLHVEFSPADDGECAIAMVIQSAEKPPLPGDASARLLTALHGGNTAHGSQQDREESEPRVAREGTDKNAPAAGTALAAKTDAVAKTDPAPPTDPQQKGIREIRVQTLPDPSDPSSRTAIASPIALAEALQRVLLEVCEKIRADKSDDDAMLADWLVRKLDLFAPAGSPERSQLADAVQPLLAPQGELTAKIRPQSQTSPAMFDGSGVDEFILARGQSKLAGAQVPRRFLEAISGAAQPEIKNGSGRLDLAQRITDPANPLTSRVIVNRVWHHLFGRGIVQSVDNLGVLGQPPSHRELLDHLAARFVKEQGWSVKKLIREIVLSRTYEMSSQPTDAAAEQADPENLLLHRTNLRRLEGEAIRDAMLAISGRLDPKLGGPPVPVFLSTFMDGRGKPSRSGPLDGDGRRSIYTAVRRNFLQPMMLAFDTPIPFMTMGRRNVSNVPAQALILMNDPFVVEQAKLWSQRLTANSNPAQRVQQMYLAAFSRPPTPAELADANTFLTEQRTLYGAGLLADEQSWADFAHVLFNVKEFIYLN